MTLFEGEQNGRYETDHLHMVLNEHIDFTEEGLSDDRKYSIFVHEYVHYYQHFATLYGSQFCKMANLLFIETRAFLEGADKVVMPFGIWEHNEGISRYRNRVKAVCGSKSCSHIVGDVEIDRREIRIAEEEKKAVKIGVYDYTEDEAYEDGFNFGYYCIIESMAHLIQRKIWPEVEHNQIPYESGFCGLLMWLYTGDIKDRKQFMTLVNAYGLPYIETPEMTYLPNNNETGHPYFETATLAGFELIFRRLQKIDGDICPMYRVCKDGRFSEESNVDELCGKEQWKKDCECLMVRALKYYKLKDKEFVS